MSFHWLVSTMILSGLILLQAQSETEFSTKERIARIRELGKSNSQAIPALSGYLGDQDREIRLEAVKAIVKLDTRESIDPLIKATRDNDPEIQIRATDGLVNFYVPGYVVKSGLTSSITRGVRQAKSFFSSRNDDVVDPDITVRTDVEEALAALVRGGSSLDSRSNAARAAGILRAKSSVPALEEALRSKNTELIFESLIALQKIKDVSAGTSAGFLTNDLDDRVQAAAIETIGILHSADSAPDVRRALQNARNAKIRRASLEALAMLALPADRPLFKDYLEDRDTELRSSALEGLGRLREPEDYPLIEQAYDEKDASAKVHLAAAFALVCQGKVDTSDFSPLRYLFDNLDSKSQGSIAEIYVTELSQNADVCRALSPLALNGTRDQKLAICRAFAHSNSAEASQTLQTLSKDIDPGVSLAAVKSLKAITVR